MKKTTTNGIEYINWKAASNLTDFLLIPTRYRHSTQDVLKAKEEIRNTFEGAGEFTIRWQTIEHSGIEADRFAVRSQKNMSASVSKRKQAEWVEVLAYDPLIQSSEPFRIVFTYDYSHPVLQMQHEGNYFKVILHSLFTLLKHQR